MVPTLFAATIFLAAALSFLVQPLIGKQLLPVLGGTPGVWNSCLVFFQSALLLAYFLAHRSIRSRLSFRIRLLVHVLLLSAALTATAFGGRLKPDDSLVPTDSELPVVAVLIVLGLTVGAPYLALAMTAPLLQAWYARFGRDPYPLYAASNLGSFTGLLGYPLAVEPSLPLAVQREWWIVGFAAVAALIALCGFVAARTSEKQPSCETSGPSIPARRALKWIALAALPSSLLMSATTHLTTDIAPVPLLWVVPLGLYLLSFVVVFASWPPGARRIVGRVTPMFLCFLAVALLTRANTPIVLVSGIHLGAFLFVALLCHGELAADRPAPNQLTNYYLWLSVGGVLGGSFNSLLAPWLFAGVGHLEYPIAIVLAGLVRPPSGAVGIKFKPMDGVWPFALGIVAALLVVGVPWLLPADPKAALDDPFELLKVGGLSFGLPAALAFALVWRPVRFALCLAVLLAVGSFAPNPHGRVLDTRRNYFGTLRVTASADGRFHRIVHGTTLHGQQLWPGQGRPDPATYYHRKGPFGRLMEQLPVERRLRVGVVGLGCGATAAYADAGQRWTFYEIDPAVVRVARDERFFTFLSTCPIPIEIVLGDARRRLRAEPDAEFDLLVLDAFSSDAVPAHLLTKEAFELYRRLLKPDGALALHVSNRYLDLAPLVVRTLRAVDPDSFVQVDDDVPTETNKRTGQTESTWVFATRRPPRGGRFGARWGHPAVADGPVWTDDFSNLLGVWKRDE